MKSKHIWVVLIWIYSGKLSAQPLNYLPDMVIGNRSFTYLHNIKYHFNDRVKINNLTLFDTEYKVNKSNIYFIRNTLSYNFSKNISLNTAFGIKNPGTFFTFSGQFRTQKPTYSFAYSLGTTYQRGLTLEQAMAFDFSPHLTEKLRLYFSFLAIANLKHKEYQRGIQLIRLGLKEKKASYGFALNLDQFNNNTKTLENTGIFIKYNF